MTILLNRVQVLELLDVVDPLNLSVDYNPTTQTAETTVYDFTKQGDNLVSTEIGSDTTDSSYWNNGEYLGEFTVTEDTLLLIKNALEKETDEEERDALVTALSAVNRDFVPE